jgi:hypothetical protein
LDISGETENKHEEAKPMGQTRIPVDISFEHFMAMRSILQHALQDFELTVGYEPKWLTCRLNQSGTTETTEAFFLGWVENTALRDIRIGLNRADPGLFRFLDPVHGDTYKRALDNPTQILKQEWKKMRGPGNGFKPQPPLKLFLDNGFYQLTSGCEICRQSIAIKVDDRYVGTLNTGLSKDPGSDLDEKMKTWSQHATSELVQYLRNEFNLGGPVSDAGSTKTKVARTGKKR